MQIKYEMGTDDELYCRMDCENQAVAVGEAAGAGDQAEWEIIDAKTGERLDFRRITDDHTTPHAIWPELMMKAHVLLLDLVQKARAQAKLDKEWAELLDKCRSEVENVTRYLEGDLLHSRNVDPDVLERLRITHSHLEEAGDELDLIDDPDQGVEP